MKKSIQGLYLASLALLGVLAIVFRTAALLTGFDFETGYFSQKLLNNISITAAVTAVVLFATFLIYKKDYKPCVSAGSPKDYIPAACTGVMLVIMAFEIALRPAPAATVMTSKIGDFVTSAAAILAALAAFYFLFSVIFRSGAPELEGAFSMAIMLFLAFYALMLYFDPDTPLNSPAKLCDQMAYASASLFFVYETRIALKRPIWKMYVVTALWATLLTAYSAIPTLITYLVRGEIISNTISECILTLSIFAFCLVRVISVLTANEGCDNKIVELVKAMHSDRIT